MTTSVKKLVRSPLSTCSLFLPFLLFGCAREFEVKEPEQAVQISHQLPIYQGQNIPIYIDRDFSPKLQKCIERAISQWNLTLSEQITLSIVSTSFDMEPSVLEQAEKRKIWLILAKHETSPNIPSSKCQTGSTCFSKAWTDEFEGHILNVVLERVSEKDLEATILHEIGHLFNLRHSSAHNLMNSHFSLADYSCIDKDTAEKVSHNYGLSFDRMNYCIKN